MDNLESIMFYAFRYALGRRTYAVYDVSQFLIKNQKFLHKNTKNKIIEEIQEAIDANNIGMEMDELEWLQLSEVLSE